MEVQLIELLLHAAEYVVEGVRSLVELGADVSEGRERLFLLDEPESALSPQRQLVLLAHMWNLVSKGTSQFIIATHSPILLTFPGSDLIAFAGGALERVKLEDTSHYQITRGILQSSESYWKHLRLASDPEPGAPSVPKPRARRRKKPEP
jgi:ABC-type hemin transport system ATPase subunit